VAIASDGDAGCRPPGPDVTDKPPDVGVYFDAGRRLARPRHHGHRTPGGGIVDVDRQEAVVAVMGVEQRQLLVAVDDVAGVVDVKRDAFGRRPAARHPLVDQRVGQADGVVQGRCILKA